MADEQPEQEKEVTPKGAVEVDEKDLDKAEGGFSINFTKTATTDPLVQKVAPTDVLAGPGAGPHVVPEKKI